MYSSSFYFCSISDRTRLTRVGLDFVMKYVKALNAMTSHFVYRDFEKGRHLHGLTPLCILQRCLRTCCDLTTSPI
jgi:hypothetical protein